MGAADGVARDPALARLVEQVLAAQHAGTPLEIRGGGTKRFYGGMPRGEPLDLRPLAGISSHEPTELVVTARAGTPLVELEEALARHGQCLPFEPPHFGDMEGGGSGIGTVGGMVAAGLAGPSRAAVGSVRDFVLGATVLNGRGELLSFGGQVMKNVAGYDLARLMAGSMGVLGVICEVSLKVLPAPAAQATIEFEFGQADALDWIDRLRAQPLPLRSTSWHDGCLRVRLAGARAAVEAAGTTLGGRLLEPARAEGWWRSVRDQRAPFFDEAGRGDLWRLSLPPATPTLALDTTPLLEWGGAQRWWRTTAPTAAVRAIAAAAGGHATLFRAAERQDAGFMPLGEPLARLHRELKTAFDPAGIFNRGRLYPQF